MILNSSRSSNSQSSNISKSYRNNQSNSSLLDHEVDEKLRISAEIKKL